MMDEMQKTLARRRAKVDRSSEEPDSGEAADQGKEKGGSPGKPYPVSGGGSQAGSESPKPGTVSQLSCQHCHNVSHPVTLCHTAQWSNAFTKRVQ